MRDDDFIQVVLIVSGDTEQVQLVALLIVSDLQTTSKLMWLTSSTEKLHPYNSSHQQQCSAPGDTAQPLNHLFIPAHT